MAAEQARERAGAAEEHGLPDDPFGDISLSALDTEGKRSLRKGPSVGLASSILLHGLKLACLSGFGIGQDVAVSLKKAPSAHLRVAERSPLRMSSLMHPEIHKTAQLFL